MKEGVLVILNDAGETGLPHRPARRHRPLVGGILHMEQVICTDERRDDLHHNSLVSIGV